MSEIWRVKKYYRPRVLIGVSDVLDSPFSGRLVPLTAGEVDLLRNLLQYAHRRSTFVSSYREQDYLAPSTEEWDELQSVVAGLEGKLMSDCCEDLLDRLDTLIGQGEAAAAWMEDAQEFLECICTATQRAASPSNVSVTWPPTDAPPEWWTYDNSDADQTLEALAAATACGLAQAWYQAGFELITERFLPAFRFGWDALQQALVAAITVATGGAGIPIAFGVFVTAELVQLLLDVAYDASEANLYNWMVANKQDVVCGLYDGLQAGGATSDIWASVYDEFVADSEELTDGDKLIMSVLAGNIAAATAKSAQDEDTTWYQGAVTPGYCSTCPIDPIIGSDWVAVPVSEIDGALHILKPGTGGVTLCNLWDVPNGRTMAGYVLHTTERVGSIAVKYMNAQAWGCGADLTFTPDSSTYCHTEGWYYVCNTSNHNYTGAVAALCPGATVQGIGYPRTGPTETGIAYLTEGDATGEWTAVNLWIVYTGTSVPPQPWY